MQRQLASCIQQSPGFAQPPSVAREFSRKTKGPWNSDLLYGRRGGFNQNFWVQSSLALSSLIHDVVSAPHPEMWSRRHSWTTYGAQRRGENVKLGRKWQLQTTLSLIRGYLDYCACSSLTEIV
jgi:hypothetical protein